MRVIALSSAGLALASMLVWVACSNSSTPSQGTTPTDAGQASDAATAGLFTLGVACTDSFADVYGDPGTLPAGNGDIIKCAIDSDIARSDLYASAKSNVSGDALPAQNTGYAGAPFTSGAHTYRILYRTERGDNAASPGYSSAKVFIPDTPRVASGKLPILIGARGSRGQAGICIASQENDAASWVNGDYEALSYPMVGLGFPIIVPDLAGYSNFGAPGNPISNYEQYQDVAKSTLDGARALAKMFPNAFNGKVAIVGHSQGGGSALAATALQPSYAPDLNLVAVAVYAPLWVSPAAYGALLFTGEADQYPLATNPSYTAISAWYHYTEGELLDGPGHGLDPFLDASVTQAAVLHFVNNDCWDTGYDGGLSSAGIYPDLQAVATIPSDLFDPAFIASVSPSAALSQIGQTNRCPVVDDGGLDPVCVKWVGRYANDRPHLTNPPPMLIEYGADDMTLNPGLMECVIGRLKGEDHVPYSFCLDPAYGHEGVVRAHADYVASWIGAQTLGEPAPAACAFTDANLTEDGGVGGTTIDCTQPPPN
jgi:pimeloyl-ACP methyl ester carboxylesterase